MDDKATAAGGRNEDGREADAAADAFGSRQEKLAYLAGLAEGLEREDDPATASLLGGIVEVLTDMAHELGAIRREQISLAEDLDELADEIGVSPTDVIVECPACGSDVAFAKGLMDEDELELTCPNCGEVVYTPGEDELVDGRRSRARGTEPGVVGRRPSRGDDPREEGP